MRIRKRWLFGGSVAALALGFATLAHAMPGNAACAFVEFAGYETLADGTLVEPTLSPAERASVEDLQVRARARISDVFGSPLAKPFVVFFREEHAPWPFKLNTTASASFLPGRACIFIGPQGQDIDVVAHELMHAEIFDRVGFWRRQIEVPTWFDEGVAMQIDHREDFILPVKERDPDGTAFVRQLKYGRQFFVADKHQLIRNYAAAKVEAARLFGAVGPAQLYDRLDSLRAGENFEALFDN